MKLFDMIKKHFSNDDLIKIKVCFIYNGNKYYASSFESDYSINCSLEANGARVGVIESDGRLRVTGLSMPRIVSNEILFKTLDRGE